MDFDRMTRQLVRALRGKRTQAALSKRLGFRTNTIHTWESGRHAPTAAQLFEIAERTGVDVKKAISGFQRQEPHWLRHTPLSTKRGVVLLLNQLRGKLPLVELARQSGFSRFAISRWLKGIAEPKTPEFLAFVQCCTHRVADFVASFADPRRVPEVTPEWTRQNAARRAAYELPWSQAVLRALELADYSHLDRHRPGWIAERIGIRPEEEARCLEILAETGQTHFDGRRWVVGDVGPVDLRHEPAAARAQRKFWAGVGAERVERGGEMFAYNVCGVSTADLERLQQLQLDYLKQARAIIAASEPVQHVAVLQVQVFALG